MRIKNILKSSDNKVNQLKIDDEKYCNYREWLSFTIYVFLFSRVVMLLCIYFAQYYNFFSFQTGWHDRPMLDILSNEWDSVYFISQARTGGFGGAFFPLYPLLIKIFSVNGFFPIAIIGVILNQVMLFLSIYVLSIYLSSKNMTCANIKFACIILAISPMNVFFSATYAETTMLLFSILGFYALQRDKYYLAAICTFILSCTKLVGGAFIIIIIIDFFLKKRKNYYHLLLQLIIASSGIFLYSIYCFYVHGDALYYITAESHWGRTGWIFSSDSLRYFVTNCIYGFKRDVLTFCLSLFLTIVMFKKKYIKEGIYNLLCILPAVISGSSYGIFYSSARLDAALVTFYIGIALLCEKREFLKLAIIIFSTIFLLESWIMWVGHHWLD